MMIWSVTYRGEGGLRDTLEIEASDRGALFDELRRRGISAISVAEVDPSQKTRRSTAKRPVGEARHSRKALRGVIAGFAVVAASIAVWHFISSSAEKPADAEPVDNNLPAKTPIRQQAGATGATPVADEVAGSEKPNVRLYKGVAVVSSSATTNGVDGAIIERLRLADGRTVKVVSLPKPLFENPSDQLIAMALSSQTGQSVAPMPIDCNVEQEFLNSLLTPIKINEDDTDNVKELKANVLEARAYIADEVKAGKSVREVLEDYQRQMNNIADHHLMAVQEVQKIKTEYGIEEARKFAIRVNESLRARGIPEISVPKVDEEQHSNSK